MVIIIISISVNHFFAWCWTIGGLFVPMYHARFVYDKSHQRLFVPYINISYAIPASAS